jgi:uncharacterized membrane protein
MSEKPAAGDIPGPVRRKSWIWLLAFCGLLLVAWLANTPPGLLGKTDAVGYAVCHRIGSHSFYLGDRPFSLCARCTGQYLGFFWGFLAQLVWAKKRSGFPRRWTLAWLAVLALFYLLDGFNATAYLYPSLSRWLLYQPSNSLRLFSGLGMGLVISAILYPLFGQTVWKDQDPEPASADIQVQLLMLAGALALGGLTLSGNALILYPLILLSTGGLLALLTILYGVIWILLAHRENSFSNWYELGWFGLGGFSSAMVQIALIDLVRFWLTGTWSGFLDY